MNPDFVEVNFDGMVGPTHNYAGLSRGNLASMGAGGSPSNPKKAALQALAKMWTLADLGIPQGVLPPQERPATGALRLLGFRGSEAQILEQAARQAPELLAASASASSMWAANAASVSPGTDTADGRVHFTPANLSAQCHRSLETATTARVLRAIFADPRHFVHHPPLPGGLRFADEGSANTMRLCLRHRDAGVEVFVYGRAEGDGPEHATRKFPARQTRDAAEAIARRHRLCPDRTVFARQNPAAVDRGAFHNDVIAVANENVLLCHAQAFADRTAIEEIRHKFERCASAPLVLIEVAAGELSVEQAVRTYFFNSQLVTLPEGGMALVAPTECKGNAKTRNLLRAIVEADNPVRAQHFVNVRQSMKNGGGPACLRLRVVLAPDQRAALHPGVVLDGDLYAQLRAWVERHYRDRLCPGDLADAHLLDECRTALDELTRILGIGSIYPFQGAQQDVDAEAQGM